MSTLKEICKEQTELLNECRQNIKELTNENEKLKDDVLAWAVTCKSLEQENKKLKEEVERLNGIIKDEEDWKTIEQEYEDWSDGE